MKYNKENKGRHEIRIDWEIASTKAFVCLRKYEETNNRKWLAVAKIHLAVASGLTGELDRSWDCVADPVDWSGALRIAGKSVRDLLRVYRGQFNSVHI